MVQTLGTLNCERSYVRPDADAPLVTPRSASYYELPSLLTPSLLTPSLSLLTPHTSTPHSLTPHTSHPHSSHPHSSHKHSSHHHTSTPHPPPPPQVKAGKGKPMSEKDIGKLERNCQKLEHVMAKNDREFRESNLRTEEARLAWEVAMYRCCQVREGGREGCEVRDRKE